MDGTKWLQKQEHFDWMQKCITCWKITEEFIAWSIDNGKYVQLINACRDAAEMCSQCIKFEAQRSPFFQQLCEVCAEICERCAGEMEKHQEGNDIMSQTVSACKVFALACREVAESRRREPADGRMSAAKNE